MQLHAIIHGRVQGVWFRASTCEIANQLSLSGWAKNLHDGTVEVIAQGIKINLNILLDWLQHGPKHAHVSKVDYEFLQNTEEFFGFEVKY